MSNSSWMLSLVALFLPITATSKLTQYHYKFQDEQYSVWVLDGDEAPNRQVTPLHPEYPIRKAAVDLVAREYTRLGFGVSPDVNDLLNARRSLVMITEKNHPTKPHQVVSIAKSHEEHPVPIVQRMGQHGVDLNFHSYPAAQWARSFELTPTRADQLDVRANYSQTVVVPGNIWYPNLKRELRHLVAVAGAVEMKSYVRSSESPRSFLPLLSHFVTAHRLLDHSQYPIPDWFIYEHRHAKTIHVGGSYAQVSLRTFNHSKDAEPSPFVNEFFRNRDVVAVAHEARMSEYLQRAMDFVPLYEIQDPDRQGKATYILRLPVQHFAEINHLRIFRSAAGELLKEGKIEFVTTNASTLSENPDHFENQEAPALYPPRTRNSEATSANMQCEDIVRRMLDPRAEKDFIMERARWLVQRHGVK